MNVPFESNGSLPTAITHCVVVDKAGYVAVLSPGGGDAPTVVETYLLSTGQRCASRALHPCSALVPISGLDSVYIGCCCGNQFRINDVSITDKHIIDVPSVSCCAVTTDDIVWVATDDGVVARHLLSSPVITGLSRCVALFADNSVPHIIVVHRQGALTLSASGDELRRISVPSSSADEIVTASWDVNSGSVVASCDRGIVIMPVLRDEAPRFLSLPPACDRPVLGCVWAGTAMHWLAHTADDAARTLRLWTARSLDLSVASVLHGYTMDLPNNVGTVLSITVGSDGRLLVSHSAGVWMMLPAESPAVADGDVAKAVALGALEHGTAHAQLDEDCARRLTSEGRAATRSRFAIDVSIDTADLNSLRDAMCVYVSVRLLGDLRQPLTMRIALPPAASFKDILRTAETALNRRVSVAFVGDRGKLVELNPSTQHAFDVLPDAKKMLICRSLFPGVPLTEAQYSASGPRDTPSGAIVSSINSSGSPKNASSIHRSVTPSAMSKEAEQSMVRRLYETSVAARRTNSMRLERSFYPTRRITASEPLQDTVERLAGPSATNRKREAIARARQACINDGTIVEPRQVKLGMSEEELATRMYDERLKAVREHERALEQKYLFRGRTNSRIKLRSKEDWERWHASMARDIRQTFRLPPDQMYYGKPSPRDRGHM